MSSHIFEDEAAACASDSGASDSFDLLMEQINNHLKMVEFDSNTERKLELFSIIQANEAEYRIVVKNMIKMLTDLIKSITTDTSYIDLYLDFNKANVIQFLLKMIIRYHFDDTPLLFAFIFNKKVFLLS
jgi:hypothetical protein